ncbi:MAG: hypothetical protein FWD06_04205 [Oscillospiraceae bacterium]|nr:hypothetical protein [Oscillospiraceae bacterium]
MQYGVYFITFCVKDRHPVLGQIQQSGAYVSAITNAKYYQAVRQYVHENPVRWQEDEFYA